MKKIALFLTAALLLGGIALCAGCVSTDQVATDPIVGQWELNLEKLGANTFIFNADGTGYMSYNILDVVKSGSELSWTKNDESYLVTNTSNGEMTTASISDDGKILEFTPSYHATGIAISRVFKC